MEIEPVPENGPPDTQFPPPPPYSEHNPSYSGYSDHERTPTAPPASLIHDSGDFDASSSTAPTFYPMPSPSGHHTNYGAVPTRYVPDVDEPIRNIPFIGNPPPQQQSQPLLSPPSSPLSALIQTSGEGFQKTLGNFFQDAKKKWRKKWTLYLIGIFVLVLFSSLILCEGDYDAPPPFIPGKVQSTVMMTSPYPLSPFHTDYSDPDDLAHLPPSQLTTLRIDFSTHSGELHIVSTEDPVSWLSFSTQKRLPIGDGGHQFQLESTFTRSLDNKTLDVMIKNDHTSGQLVSILYMSRHDRQQGRLVVEVGDQGVYLVSQDPDVMVQDIDLTLKGSTEGVKLPSSSNSSYWKGRNLRLKLLQGSTDSLVVPRLEASDTIELDVSGVAGGDIHLDQSIKAGRLIKLRTRNGSIVMSPSAIMQAESIDLATTNSKLAVAGLQPTKTCSLQTVNGHIEATLLANDDKNTRLELLKAHTENAAIHLTVLSPQIKQTSLVSNLGSITMHAVRISSLSSTSSPNG